jgi:hypothetical protein
MAVIVHVMLPDVTEDQYDRVRAAAGWLDKAPDGGIAHVTWWEGAACHNVDAWESEAAFNAFVEQRLGPAMAQAGVDAQPQITFHAAHEVFLPKAVTLTVS